jgi:hypothetical protein
LTPQHAFLRFRLISFSSWHWVQNLLIGSIKSLFSHNSPSTGIANAVNTMVNAQNGFLNVQHQYPSPVAAGQFHIFIGFHRRQIKGVG